MLDPAESTVGLIGLGNLGAPVARRLGDRGWRTSVYDVAPEKAATLTDAAVRVAGSLDEVMNSDVLVLVVPDDSAVEAVLTGEEGYFARRSHGGCVVVHSTVLPATVERLAVEASRLGVDLIDAPVSGGASRARSGDLTLFLGGDEAAIARVETLLGSVASTIEPVGKAGAGAAVKLANQLMLFAALGGAHEALRLAGSFGVDEGALFRAVATSTGASWVTENWGFFDEASRAYSAGGTPFRQRPWSKDLLEVLIAARSVDLPVPLAATLSQTLGQYVEDHVSEGEGD